MTSQLSQLKWVRIVITSVVVCLASILAVVLIVTAYATVLAFQARGAPDPDMLDAFANQSGPWLALITLVLFTLLAARQTAKRVPESALLHGLAVGVVTGLINLALEFVGGAPDLMSLLTTALTVGAGWLGGRMAGGK